jgi:hypothetical protein
MLIVDAQIHLWNAGNPTSPWHRQIPAYLKEDALKEMDAGGVDAAILTPHTPWDPNANELSTRPHARIPTGSQVADGRHRRLAVACSGAGRHRLYDAFGPARWFWGTDITRMPCSWRQCVTLFTEELPWLKGRDLELVMGRAVCDWLEWKR